MPESKRETILKEIKEVAVKRGDDEEHIEAGISVLNSASDEQLAEVLKSMKGNSA